MKLGWPRKKLGGGDGTAREPDVERARELVDTAHRSAKEAIDELRDLARGIHPPVLDRGLDAALATLAARSAVPVELIVDVPERPVRRRSRPSPTSAPPSCWPTWPSTAAPGGPRRGGARAADCCGSGSPTTARAARAWPPAAACAGSQSRVRTVDGRLEIDSPPGGPTVVTVELPSHA